MSFSVVIQRNNSESNVVNKSVSDIATYTGTLRDGTSIVDPSIMVHADISDLKNANYMHISAFGRYYYITDIKSIKNGIVEITGHTDVLKSFASAIKGSEAIIKRQEKDWNLYLNDGVLKVYQNPNIITKYFPNGFPAGNEFVLAIAGSAE